MRTRSHIAALFSATLLTLLAATQASAQVIHLPPFYRPVIGQEDSLLFTIRLRSDLSDGNIPRIRIQVDDDHLIITRGDNEIDVFQLANRSIRDVVAEVKLKYDEILIVRTNHPLRSTSFIGPMTTTTVTHDSVVSLPSAASLPQVEVGFGAVLSMPGPDNDVGRGLLSQTGFQLDLSGSFQLVGRGQPTIGGDDRWLGHPIVYLRGRLGLGADQNLQVETDEQGVVLPAGEQYGVALEQADQISVSAQFDIVIPLRKDRWDFVVTPLYGISWTRLDQLALPATVRVSDENRPLTDVFTSDVIARTLRRSQEVLPLGELALTGTFQFSRRGPPIYYFGGGIMNREYIRRGFGYRFIDVTEREPDPESLVARMTVERDVIWRAMFGARLAGVLDVRLDASGPIGGRDREPLLRVVLGRTFPVVR